MSETICHSCAAEIIDTLSALRVPIQQGEYDLHALVMEALMKAGLPCIHEAVLGPRCRVDILCGQVGIEIKRGKPDRTGLVRQLCRYAATGKLREIVVVSEKHVALPRTIGEVRVTLLCLNRLWGIALT